MAKTRRKDEFVVQILRQASFLMTDVWPHISDGEEIEISVIGFLGHDKMRQFLEDCGIDTRRIFEVHRGLDKNRVTVVQRLGHVGALTFGRKHENP